MQQDLEVEDPSPPPSNNILQLILFFYLCVRLNLIDIELK